jgi:hypothetical protein
MGQANTAPTRRIALAMPSAFRYEAEYRATAATGEPGVR